MPPFFKIMKTQTTPLDTLKTVFGYSSFRPHQKEIIEEVLEGKDVFVLMPTGGGKSLCYQIPALHRIGTAIVVSPLISLMKDQVDALRANGVNAAQYNSTLSEAEARSTLSALHNGELDLLYVAPERLMSKEFLERLQSIPVALFAIDEAHCVSQWGHNFRPEYVQLGRLRQLFSDIPLIALTATADSQTREDILHRLGLKNAKCYSAGFDRPNIRYTVVDKHKPFDQLSAFLAAHSGEAGIVYALSRKRTEEVAEKLAEIGVKAAPYHAGLPASERKRVQEDFLKDNIEVVVATVAFGMGIDKPNVRFVVHYDIPKNIESYYQETGRAGRDGLPAEALLLFGYGDIAIVRGLIENGNNEDQKRIEIHKLNSMIGYAEPLTCRRRALLGYFGEELPDEYDSDGCGNCDICLNPPECYDATEDARKALSCVFRLEQRFGAGHVVDVLRGSENQRIMSLGHNRLSTYGIGAERSKEAWGALIRQLIQLGYLKQDLANYSILQLTEAARPLLRGELKLNLPKPRIQPKTLKKQPHKKIGELDYDPDLFQTLRKLRKELADSMGVPPYIVFGDAALLEMAAYRPMNEEAFIKINGVGQRKMEQYGESFISAIVKMVQAK